MTLVSLPSPNHVAFTVSDNKRRFVGVGYSGGVIPDHPQWGNLIFDMTDVNLAASIPILLEHDTTAIVGHAEEFSISSSGELVIQGTISNVTEEGKLVSALSDEGFPWQMSVYIEPQFTSKIEEGTNKEVNGKIMPGPMTVFHGGSILEVSFCSLGWDRRTTATVLSRIENNECFNRSEEVQVATPLIGGDTEGKSVDIQSLRDENAALAAKCSALEKKFSEMEEERKREEDEKKARIAEEAFSQACGGDKEKMAAARPTIEALSKLSLEAVNAAVSAMQFARTVTESGAKLSLPPALTSDVATSGADPNDKPKGEDYLGRVRARFSKKGAN
jgi:hypothetical protein